MVLKIQLMEFQFLSWFYNNMNFLIWKNLSVVLFFYYNLYFIGGNLLSLVMMLVYEFFLAQACFVCKRKSHLRCVRCIVATHQNCAPWPDDITFLRNCHGQAICWRHPNDWRLDNKVNLFFPSSVLYLLILV